MSHLVSHIIDNVKIWCTLLQFDVRMYTELLGYENGYEKDYWNDQNLISVHWSCVSNRVWSLSKAVFKEWDTVLNELLDSLENGKASAEMRDHCLRFSFEKEAYDVWVANRWYAYGNLYAEQKLMFV